MRKKTRGRGKSVGPKSERLTVHRTDRERGFGAGALYSYGYLDLAAVLESDTWRVAHAVVTGALEPLSLIALVAARKHGLSWSFEQQLGQTGAWDCLLGLRPERVTTTCSVRPPSRPTPYGLGDLWAITYRDVADAIGYTVEQVHSDAKPAQRARLLLRICDLASVLDYVEFWTEPALLAKLGIERVED